MKELNKEIGDFLNSLLNAPGASPDLIIKTLDVLGKLTNTQPRYIRA